MQQILVYQGGDDPVLTVGVHHCRVQLKNIVLVPVCLLPIYHPVRILVIHRGGNVRRTTVHPRQHHQTLQGADTGRGSRGAVHSPNTISAHQELHSAQQEEFRSLPHNPQFLFRCTTHDFCFFGLNHV